MNISSVKYQYVGVDEVSEEYVAVNIEFTEDGRRVVENVANELGISFDSELRWLIVESVRRERCGTGNRQNFSEPSQGLRAM